MYNHCQNPKCHHNPTTDRVRGSKGNKVYVTRNSTNYFGIACTYRCLYEYWTHNKEAIARAMTSWMMQYAEFLIIMGYVQSPQDYVLAKALTPHFRSGFSF